MLVRIAGVCHHASLMNSADLTVGSFTSSLRHTAHSVRRPWKAT